MEYFEDREANAMASWLLWIVFSDNQMFDVDRACLLNIGCKSG